MTMLPRVALAAGFLALAGAVRADAPGAPAAPAPGSRITREAPPIPTVPPRTAAKQVPAIIKKYVAAMQGFRTLYVEGVDAAGKTETSNVCKLTLERPNKLSLISQMDGKTVAGIVSTGRTISQWDGLSAVKSNAPPSFSDIEPGAHLNDVANYTGLLFTHPESLSNQPNLEDTGAVIFSGMMARRLVAPLGGSTLTVIISAATGLPVQFMLVGRSISTTINFVHCKVNKPVPAKVFTAPVLNTPTAGMANPDQPTKERPLLKPGTSAPDFTLSTLDGKAVTLSSYKGQAVIVAFLATWAAPSRAVGVQLQNLEQNLGSKGLNILTIDTWDTKAELTKFAQQRGSFTNTVLFDPADEPASVAARYKVTGIPTLYLIDKTGKIVMSQVGFDQASGLKLSVEMTKLGIQ